MAGESLYAKRDRAEKVCEILHERYGDAGASLTYHDPFTLTIAVLLSAQTTDKQVNKVTPELFERWPTPAAMAEASPTEVASVIKSLGFFRTKAKHCVECAQTIMADFNGEVPSTMEGLTSLPGVGRKTANIVLNRGFGITEGIAVDTHVFRISTRLGFTEATSPAAAEKDLLSIIPQPQWSEVNHDMVHFGREICTAKKPLCDSCPLVGLCPSAFHVPAPKPKKPRKKALG